MIDSLWSKEEILTRKRAAEAEFAALQPGRPLGPKPAANAAVSDNVVRFPSPQPTTLPVGAGAPVGVSLDDFVAFLPAHTFIFLPTGAHWPKESLNTTLPQQPLLDDDGAPVIDSRNKPKTISAATWPDQNRAVHGETWAPGRPPLIEDTLSVEGGFEHAPGRRTFNLYRPSKTQPRMGDASPWLNHLFHIFNEDDAKHIIGWLSHRVQHPDEKVNHCLVIGGAPGVGKDTTFEPVVEAVGPWNFGSIRVRDIASQFNEFVRSVILRVNEIHDLGDSGFSRFELYENLKIYQASPPNTLRVNGKHRREHYIQNACGLILTTNNKNGMYLPADDRRHYVAWSKIDQPNFEPGYFDRLYAWFANGGNEIVAHYLASYDYSATGFDPKATPPKTEAFWTIVAANSIAEDAAMQDAIDRLGNPAAVCIGDLRSAAMQDADFAAWLADSRNRKLIPHRLEKCDYVAVRNPDDKRDGQWKVGTKRQTVYALKALSPNEQHQAIRELLTRTRQPPPGYPPPS